MVNFLFDFRSYISSFIQSDYSRINGTRLLVSAQDFANTTMRYSQLTTNVTRPYTHLRQFNDLPSEKLWKWSAIYENPSELIYFPLT